jgi:hypothetical protein
VSDGADDNRALNSGRRRERAHTLKRCVSCVTPRNAVSGIGSPSGPVGASGLTIPRRSRFGEAEVAGGQPQSEVGL